MQIRQTTDTDIDDVYYVEQVAFNKDKEAELTKNMLLDPTATPLLSLLAYVDAKPAGHILFTKVHLTNNPTIKAQILAPLAVVPKYQKQGIGTALIKEGLAMLRKSGVDLVFVLGHPTYYPRCGFTPAGKHGFEAYYPIPEKYADAWMVQQLRPNMLGTVSGKVVPCEALQCPEHWRE